MCSCARRDLPAPATSWKPREEDAQMGSSGVGTASEARAASTRYFLWCYRTVGCVHQHFQGE